MFSEASVSLWMETPSPDGDPAPPDGNSLPPDRDPLCYGHLVAATTVVGTHATGMHSCSVLLFDFSVG